MKKISGNQISYFGIKSNRKNILTDKLKCFLQCKCKFDLRLLACLVTHFSCEAINYIDRSNCREAILCKTLVM